MSQYILLAVEIAAAVLVAAFVTYLLASKASFGKIKRAEQFAEPGHRVRLGWSLSGAVAGRFFHSVLAVEALSRVDASVGLVVDVQNTLVCNAFLRWGTEVQKAAYLPRLASGTVGSSRKSIACGKNGTASWSVVGKGPTYRLNARIPRFILSLATRGNPSCSK
jgi:alkylation response protein AidB-like acyl-CoA dehydrogenase